jgi:Domain of unknown function (DUF4432)
VIEAVPLVAGDLAVDVLTTPGLDLGPPGPERVYEHVGASRAIVRLGELRLTITSNLPRLWQWIHPEYGVLGIEPANCSVLGRAHDRAAGRLSVLSPGEARTTTLRIDVA